MLKFVGIIFFVMSYSWAQSETQCVPSRSSAEEKICAGDWIYAPGGPNNGLPSFLVQKIKKISVSQDDESIKIQFEKGEFYNGKIQEINKLRQAGCHAGVCVGDIVTFKTKGGYLSWKVSGFFNDDFFVQVYIGGIFFTNKVSSVMNNKKLYEAEKITNVTCNDISLNQQESLMNEVLQEAKQKCKDSKHICLEESLKKEMTSSPSGRCIFYAKQLGFDVVDF